MWARTASVALALRTAPRWTRPSAHGVVRMWAAQAAKAPPTPTGTLSGSQLDRPERLAAAVRGEAAETPTTAATAAAAASSVFVSSYFELPPNEVVEVVERAQLEHRVSDAQVSLKTCIACDLDERDKPDHQWTLVLNKRNGGYHCARCHASGSWFDFRQHVHGHGPGTAAGPANEPSSRPTADAVRRAAALLPESPLLAALLERGLKRTTLDHFGVGAVKVATGSAASPAEAWRAVFPWTASAGAPASMVSPPVVRLAYTDLQMPCTSAAAHAVPTVTMADRDDRGSRAASTTTPDAPTRQLEPRQGEFGLFGWDKVPPLADDLIVAANELDAMAIWQGTGRPTVALPMGTSALPVTVLPMLERFKKLYLWFDDDVPGQEAVERLARKLGKDRCFVVRSRPRAGTTSTAKSALDALKEGTDLNALVNAAAQLTHRQIVRFDSMRRDILNEIMNPAQVAGTPSLSLPSLTKILKGHRRGELTVVTGPTGIGKTSVLSQLSLDYCLQGVSTLWGSFEIRNSRLIKKMMGQLANKSFDTDPEDFNRWADMFEQLPMHFLKFFGSTSVDDVLDAMEHAHYVHDVGHVILDNLQFMTSGQGKGYERFEMQDRAIHLFRAFATSRNVHVTIVIHPRKEEDGLPLSISSVFGTAKATQEADNLVILQRGKKYRFLDVKKNRYDGELGTVPYRYDKASGRIIELTASELSGKTSMQGDPQQA